MSDALDTSFSHVVLDLGLFSSDEFVASMEDLVYFVPLVEGLVVHPHLFDVELVQGKLALILAQHDLVLSLHMHAFLLLEQLLRLFVILLKIPPVSIIDTNYDASRNEYDDPHSH